MPYSLRDWMGDESDFLEQGSMIVTKYEACLHTLSRYPLNNIFTDSKKI